MNWLRPSWWNTAIITWAIGLLGICIQGYLKPRDHTVFDIYVVGGEDWLAGRDIYVWQEQTGALYRYSPLFTAAMIPFTWVSPGLGNALWKLLNGLIFVWGVLVWARRGLPKSPLSQPQQAFLLLLCIPVCMFSLHIGQANLMLVAFCLLAFVAIREEAWWQAAAWLVAAFLIKVIPLPLLLVMMVLFPLKLLGRIVGCFAVGLVLPIVAQRPGYVVEQTWKWIQHLLESHEINQERNRNLRKLLEVWGYPQSAKTMLLVGAVAGAAVLLAGWWTLHKTKNIAQTLWVLGAWFFTWAVLHNPAAEAAAYGIISPFIAWAVLKSWLIPGAWLSRGVLVVAMFFMGPSLTDLAKLFPGLDQLWSAAVGALLFQAWLVWEFFTQSSQGGKP